MLVLAALAAASALASALPATLATTLFALAALLVWRELARAQPLRVRWLGDGSLMLDWPDGTQTPARLLAHRRLLGFTVMRLQVGTETRWIDLWPDALDETGRKALRRRLQAGLPSGASV